MADRSFSWVSAESHVVVTDQRFVLRGCNTDVDYPGWKPLEEFLLPLQGATDIQELRLVNCALTGTATRLIVGNLLDKAHLCRVDLSHNNIQHLENGCATIGRLLSLPTPSLMYLKLDWNNLGLNGAQGLAQSLRFFNPLLELSLNHCGLRGPGMDVIANALKDDNGSLALYIQGNDIKDPGGIHVGNLLKANESIQELDLSNNGIKAIGAKRLFSGLKQNSALIILVLDNNPGLVLRSKDRESTIPLHGLRAAITENHESQLMELSLCDLSIPDSPEMQDLFGKAITNLIDRSCRLQVLRLARNSIRTSAVRFICPKIRINFHLKQLYLSDNNIDDEGGFLLLDTLTHEVSGERRNTSLEVIDLTGNDIFPMIQDEIQEALQNNKTLHCIEE
jgi:Leucine Rich repeat